MDAIYSVSLGESETTNRYIPGEFTWPKLCELLTSHKQGSKSGPSICPATFSNDKRGKEYAQEISVITLDIDAGHSWEAVVAAIEATGWTAAVASTFSHMSVFTKVKRTAFELWKQRKLDSANGSEPDTSPEAYLAEAQERLPEVISGAVIDEEQSTDTELAIRHNHCPKFRIAFPMAHPWRRKDYDNLDAAEMAFKDACNAVAERLGLEIDASCVDLARLFFLPRVPNTERMELTKRCIFEGELCPALKLGADHRPAVTPSKSKGSLGFNTIEAVDPETGEVLNLKTWVVDYGSRFEIAKAAEAGKWRTRTQSGVKLSVDCPFEGSHTTDTPNGTVVANASDFAATGMTGLRTQNFTIHCSHAHCKDRDRLDFLKQAVSLKWLKVADLTDTRFLMDDTPVDTVPIDPWAEFIVPSFPLDIFPAVVSEAVADRHERTGADQAAVAMSALSAMAGALSAENTIMPRRNDPYWIERPILWTLLCGAPSSMKTPTIKWAMAGLSSMQKERMASYLEKVTQWESEPEDGRGDEPERPEQLVTNDTTYEAIVEILAVQNRGIIMHRDEFSGFIGALDRYASGRGGSAERAFYIEAWNGNAYQSNRKGRSVSVPNLAVDFIGGIQPEKLREMKDLGSDGLLQRFLPVVIKDGLLPRDIPARNSALYYELVRNMACLEPGDYTICEAGHVVLDELFERLHNLEASGVFGSSFSSFLGKMRGYSAR
ncbi:MAG: DUF3987 domain-containing protein, partial [Rhodospirillales bacterium]|nr:DUF3987 domain-containing protein [Rhodospirillales bacterium]